ncbi:hypothetical protein CDIK_0427 [Cucumispora dikerogammari]|nr:hypothetical protein CDIK_0427 [Cucumispora dikerogammari]
MNTTPAQQRRYRRPKTQPEMTQTVVFKYNQDLSTSQISREVNIPRTTVNGIIKLFIDKCRILPKNRGGNRRPKLSEENKFYLKNQVDVNPVLTLKSVVEKLSYYIQVSVDDNTVDRCLKDFHFTVKQIVTVPLRRNTAEIIEKLFYTLKSFRSPCLRWKIKTFFF